MSTSAKSRNFRRRGDDGEESNDPPAANSSNNNSYDHRHPTAAGRKPSSSASFSLNKPKKLLSFADDEEDDGGRDRKNTPPSRISSSSSKSSKSTTGSRLGKPNSSHKLTASKDRLPSKIPSTTSNVQPQAGMYTKEALLELQKNTRTLARPSSVTPTATTTTSSTSEPKIILKGLLKPLRDSEDPVPETLAQVRELEDEEEVVRRREDRNDAENMMASLGLGKSTDYSLIPDEETIKKIREKRERMRQARAAAPDYISLDSGGNGHGAAGEGLSDEEPEFTTRIAMIGNKKKESGVFQDVDNDDAVKVIMSRSHVVMDDGDCETGDEDEEEKIWEEEQFRKGLGKRMDDGSGSTTRVLTSNNKDANLLIHNQQLHQQQPQQQPQQRSAIYGGSVPSIGGVYAGSQGLDALSIPQQAEIAKKALQDNVRRLKVLL